MSSRSDTRWRTAVVLVSAAALVGAMFVAVRRDGRARRVLADTDSLRDAVQTARERLSRARRRADSLSSRPRIVEVAGRMGFRPAADTEVRRLEVSRNTEGTASERSGR